MIVWYNIVFMLIYIATSVSGLIFLKMSDGKLISYIGIAGIVLYGAGFLIWYLILTRVSLSTAFPIAAGGLVVATQIAGYFILKENLSLFHLLGVLFIIVGISIVTVGDA